MRRYSACLVLCLAALGGLGISVPAVASTSVVSDWQEKVDPWVLQTAGRGTQSQPGIQTEFLVELRERADLREAGRLRSKEERGRFVVERLREVASRSQSAVLRELVRRGIEHRAFWVANMVWVRADLTVVEALASRADVAFVHGNPQVPMDLPRVERDLALTGANVSPAGIEDSITHTGAPSVFWNAGVAGEGIVVGGADTGYEWDHPALRSAYRGWNGVSADHDYNWHDSIHTSGSSCVADSPEPCDDNGHGTHTMGTMIGDDGGSNQIGMAPGAKWIGCRNMKNGFGTPASYAECFEFFIAPTDRNGQNADPSLAPHVINNSWGCPDFEGCTDPDVLKEVVDNTRAAGITVVASAGNSGSICSSIDTPAPIYDSSFSVGSTDNSDQISSFSSRGPVTVDGSNRLKPEISAPGENIRSSYTGNGYVRLSGTSMAGPHVAGMAALVASAQSCFKQDPNAVESYLIRHALARTTSQSCGDVSGSEVPNNTYGYGALRAAMPTAADCPVAVSGTIDGISLQRGICRNRTIGQSGDLLLDGSEAWDCVTSQVGLFAGDEAVVLAGGSSDGVTPIVGLIEGVSVDEVICRNRTSGQDVTINVGGGQSWNCTTAGLESTAGDIVGMRVVAIVQ